MAEINKIEDKIKKLLTLANNNSSEEEAQSALLKAQALMAKHGVTVDILTPEEISYGTEKCTHKDNLGFRKPLASVIAKNFKCKVWITGGNVMFMGHSFDVRVAKEAFEYAYNFAYREGWKLYNKCYSEGKPTKGVFNSYALGFIDGLNEKLDSQSTALMIITPPDVEEKYLEISKNFRAGVGGIRLSRLNSEAYSEGQKDGRNILTEKRLAN